jgi:hypothetical protein
VPILVGKSLHVNANFPLAERYVCLKGLFLIHISISQDMYRPRQNARSGENLPGAVPVGKENADGKPAIRGKPPRDGDEPHLYPGLFEILLRRHHLVRSPEDENDFRGNGFPHSLPPRRLFSENDFSIIIGCRINGRETIILDSHILFLMGVIGVTALVLNLPLGYLREGQRKYSLAWFVYVHLSIPVIAYLRIANHVTSWLIPFFILCAIGGQIAGGRARRRAEKGSR